MIMLAVIRIEEEHAMVEEEPRLNLVERLEIPWWKIVAGIVKAHKRIARQLIRGEMVIATEYAMGIALRFRRRQRTVASPEVLTGRLVRVWPTEEDET